MFEQLFLIVFDRRHIKDVRIWVLVVLAIANAGSFYYYHTRIVKPRMDRQGRRQRSIIEVMKIRSKVEAYEREHPDPRDR